MRLLMVLTVLFFVFAQACSQQGQHRQQAKLEFTPASSNYFPFINSYTPKEGMKQFYLKDGTWVRNESIPNFDGDTGLKDMSLQYIPDPQGGIPQLFVYSKTTGDFRFYFLSSDGWLVNENIPGGKISINSNNVVASFSPATPSVTTYIFAHSADGAKMQLLEMVDNSWQASQYFPQDLPAN